MSQTTLRFVRKHGYVYLVPADRPELTTFKGVDPKDPAAQRAWDDINGVQVPRTPKPESHVHYQNAWQDIGVYASDDGRFELSVKLNGGEAENPPKEIQVDIAL